MRNIETTTRMNLKISSCLLLMKMNNFRINVEKKYVLAVPKMHKKSKPVSRVLYGTVAGTASAINLRWGSRLTCISLPVTAWSEPTAAGHCPSATYLAFQPARFARLPFRNGKP